MGFAKEGADLVLGGRDESTGKILSEEIEENGGKAEFLAGDVGDMDYNQQLFQLAIKSFGQLDGPVTNAGFPGLGPVTELEPPDWDITFRTNVDPVFYLLKFTLAEMCNIPFATAVVNSLPHINPFRTVHCAS